MGVLFIGAYIKYTIRVTPAEDKIIKKRLALSKNPTLNQFAKSLLLSGCLININFKELQPLITSINKVGININQIIKLANSNQYIPYRDIKEVKENQKIIERQIAKYLDKVFEISNYRE